jgi:hypothetical protein
MTAIPLRRDFDARALRSVAKKTKNAAQAPQLLALAAVCDGAMRTEPAKIRFFSWCRCRDFCPRS